LKPGREPPRAVTRRHTLGSPPESQEPIDPTVLPVLPTLPPVDSLAAGAEPLRTIYGPAWYASLERAHGMEPSERGPLLDLLFRVESGWHALRDLQRWAEAERFHENDANAYVHLLAFVDGDLVDVFREVAGGAVELVPGLTDEDDPDPEGVIADTETFARYLTLIRLAVQVAKVPGPFAVLVTSAAERLAGWAEDVAALVAVVWGENEPCADWDEDEPAD
jgi:hypothetical protein